MTFSDLVPSREIAGFCKTGFEPWLNEISLFRSFLHFTPVDLIDLFLPKLPPILKKVTLFDGVNELLRRLSAQNLWT
jgi:hypothetical protein